MQNATKTITRTEIHVPHECPVCGRTLRNLAGLKGHMRFAHGQYMVPPKQGPAADPQGVFWAKTIEGLLKMAAVSPEAAKVALEVVKLAAAEMRGPVENAETSARAAFWRGATSLLPVLPAMLTDLVNSFGQRTGQGPVAAPAPDASLLPGG